MQLQGKYIGSIVAFTITALMFGLSRLKDYEEGKGNILFVILLFLVLSAIGGILGEMMDKDEFKSVGKKDVGKKNSFD